MEVLMEKRDEKFMGRSINYKLSNKITLLILIILIIVISSMILFTYHFFKNFYKEHLANEVLDELRVYSMLIEEEFDEEIVSYLLSEKNRDRHVFTVYFNEKLEPIYSSHDGNHTWIGQYQEWIVTQLVENGETIQYVNTGIDFHIPHIWAFEPVYRDGVLLGYFFVDKDTGEFEKAKQHLALLLLSMGLFTLVIGLVLTIYLTKVISKPLIQISDATREIAKGDFDINLPITAEDEVGQLAEDIRIMTKQLKEFRDSKRQFITHISHDLRTPITYIKGYSAIMKDQPKFDEIEIKRNLDVIYNEAKRMEFLVTDLFQLTKLEEGKIKLYKDKINVIPWLKSIIASRQLMLDNQSIECKVEANRPEVMILVDQQRLGQAITNLLENSIRYTPKNGKINIIVTEEAKTTTILIKDNGIGINQEDLPRIWERFYRVDKSRSSESGGSGLGLAIVKEIVELHEGKVSVKSIEGVGTSFFIMLPRETRSN